MAECDYCGERFDDEESLLEHMAEEHEGELGRIDRRRVDDLRGEDREVPTGPLAIGFIVFAAAAVVAFVLFGTGGGGGGGATVPEPERAPSGTLHEHGTIEMVVLGEEVDFSQPKYQVDATGNPHFHFEGGDGRVWHTHSEGVTLQYAMWTLGIGVTEDAVIFEGTRYEDNATYEVNVTVNGQSVDPTSYVLDGASADNAGQGDHISIVVAETDGD